MKTGGEIRGCLGSTLSAKHEFVSKRAPGEKGGGGGMACMSQGFCCP